MFPLRLPLGYSLIKACDRETDEALCWAVYRVDRQHAKVQQVSIGKYGGLEWVQWSSDERYAGFLEKMEGTAWFIVLNLETGESQLSGQLPAQPDLTSFVWTGDRAFKVTLNNGAQFQGNIDAYLQDKSQICKEARQRPLTSLGVQSLD